MDICYKCGGRLALGEGDYRPKCHKSDCKKSLKKTSYDARCCDCGLDYEDAGFQDLIVSNDVWRRISSKGDDGGLLCPTCLIRALVKAGIKTEGSFMSGPIISITQSTMMALRQIENLRESYGLITSVSERMNDESD